MDTGYSIFMKSAYALLGFVGAGGNDSYGSLTGGASAGLALSSGVQSVAPAITVDAMGGGDSANVQPTIILNYIIKV